MVGGRCSGLFWVVGLRGHRSTLGLLLRQSGILGVCRRMVGVVVTLGGLFGAGNPVRAGVVRGSSARASSLSTLR